MPGITVTPATVAFTARHPGVTVRLPRTTWFDQVEVLRDGRADLIGPGEVALAWVATRRSRLVRDFARAAQDTLADAHAVNRPREFREPR
ncbi:hypothetical protein [Streptomyces sp. B93]|uniref:hypothetical protein n=1 Tax=Streptomyces sp. B93 TaxID=2824875 RepID=UPI001FFD98A6|nr:hypothetical protein [Streptomyces sp. B93]